MSLLKYFGRTKVIKVLGEREPEKIVMDGPFGRRENVYPEGIERVVEKYFLFPTRVGDTRIRGKNLIKQVCKHATIPEGGDPGKLRFEH